MRTITIATGYTIIARNGRVLYDTIDVFEAFRVARRRNAIIERTDIHGEQAYMDANANTVIPPAHIIW
jgi:hypothetical protein